MDKKAMKKIFLSDKMAVICMILILLIVLAAIFAHCLLMIQMLQMWQKKCRESAVHIFWEQMILDEIHLPGHCTAEGYPSL